MRPLPAASAAAAVRTSDRTVHPGQPSRASGAGGLLAIRRAGAAFDGPFAVRSPRFEALLRERAGLRAELSTPRASLVDALHRAVPAAPDRAARRRLLDLKRAVYNDRPLPAGEAPPPADAEIAPALARYAALRGREARLLPGEAAAVVAEQRAALLALLDDPAFRAACRYSSPALWEEVERGGDEPPAGEFSSRERGLYAYAARFATKANPLHLFAEIGFAPASGVRADAPHELVLDLPALLALEERVLPAARGDGRGWLALRPWTREGERLRFHVATPRGLRVVSLAEAPPVAAVLAFFAARREETGRPVGTRADCARSVAERLGSHDPRAAAGLLDALVERGILQEYLLDDPASLWPALSGAGPASDARVRRLARVHLAPLDADGLARAEDELAALPPDERPAHYVNRFGPPPAPAREAAARALRGDLAALRPFFCASHNFSANEAVVRAFLRERLGEAGRAPLLALVGPFMRELDDLLARHHPRAARAGTAREREAAWRAALARESGTVDAGRLRRLLPEPLPPERPLCFNGPLDLESGTFYVSNVWAGDGRFVARYRLDRARGAAPARGPEGEDALDVELAVPPRTTLTWVVRRHRAGCGFDPRQAHAFERWIGPEEIEVATGGGEVRYLHAPTGRRLRIHYRGFLLAEYLPAECQLLLAGHADTFANPFLAPVRPGPGAAPAHVRALRVGAVCVRRERWVARADAVAPLLEGDPLSRAARLRDWVHARCAEEDLWYHRAWGGEGRAVKPRFLDLRNPLSVTAFRREVQALPPDAAVSLSPMRPGPAGMERRDGAPVVTELMVEA